LNPDVIESARLKISGLKGNIGDSDSNNNSGSLSGIVESVGIENKSGWIIPSWADVDNVILATVVKVNWSRWLRISDGRSNGVGRARRLRWKGRTR